MVMVIVTTWLDTVGILLWEKGLTPTKLQHKRVLFKMIAKSARESSLKINHTPWQHTQTEDGSWYIG